MNKTKQVIIAIIALTVLGGGGYWLANNNQDLEPKISTGTQLEVGKAVELTKSEDGKTVSYAGQTGKTALAILQSIAEVKTQKSDFGDFVTGINGVTANSTKEYWSFYVNGGYANEGAGTYDTTNGEKIEWRLEQL